MNRTRLTGLTQAALLASTILVAPQVARADRQTVIDGNNGPLPLPTGQYITPQALTGAVQQPLNPGLPAYPAFVAGEAVRSQLSPDGTLLAIICAGQNSLDGSNGSLDTANSTQYIFIYNVGGANKTQPVLQQVIKQTNAHVGLVWSPDGNTLYGAGGADDAVYAYAKQGGAFVLAKKIALGHGANKVGAGLGGAVEPNASGLGISSDGTTLVAANNYNDSVSVIDTASGGVLFEHDLRPFATGNEGTAGAAGGTFPFAVAVTGTQAGGNLVAYVSSDRDREVDVVRIATAPGSLVTRIKLDGNALGMTLNADQSRLYVAQDNADEVAVINTATNQIIQQIDARAPAGIIPNAPSGGRSTGAATYGVTLNGNTLYAVNAGANSIAVIPLTGTNANTVTGLIPTAYEPHDITFSADGSWMYIVNGKNDTGPNPGYTYGNTASLGTVTLPGGNVAASAAGRAANQYQFQLERATLVSAAVPASTDLAQLTSQVAVNNLYTATPNPNDTATMSFLHGRIQHVIYIVKENRTFDQILGDLGNGANGDPTLALFGKRITPSYHRLASQFVTLDNFMDPGDGSMDGWAWSLQGRVTNTETITQQINYAFVDRGLSYESEGTNRNVPVQLGTTAARDAATGGQYSTIGNALPGGAANLLAGTGDHAASDAPFGYQLGYIFDAVLQSGGTVRNYGFLTNNIGAVKDSSGNAIQDPFTAGVVQVAALNPALVGKTDLFFRGYDQAYPDLWRFNEWNREFQQFVTNGQLPSLELVRLAHDHTGSFATALAGVNTPEAQEADNDYSVGKVIETVANSPYAANTLIIVTEDDCQDGPDHFDSHRATAYVVGPYVKQGVIVSTRYNQVSVLRTIEDVLGTPHINLNTAYQRPMADVFDTTSSGAWTFTAQASRVLATTTLAQNDNGIRYAEGPDVTPKHDMAYWAEASRGFDFSDADRVPADLYNEVLWEGVMDGQPYPVLRSRLVLHSKD